ncbi:DNA-formamidopyrimidine glycosylase [Candidatus Woesebacteria bacterium RIFCSPHIGHO2_01_FULL_39_32]|uniref:Formamidopyrimidine-DNA glycosylase n=2 Tax=Candidatus Woeseibacteriota TaxID=1752722 RepID=A0A0G0SXM2_9BACT|nr:MAG: Formamidopyrimidine-DNA glycosylase [Candidatus Woesebacteria bacterium GW2011_GWA1_39_8]OGM24469.1 MAG: DNA-formamidopyrimidine glycosylase [Candidatus Woesebacteria bacterium RIFCSPHIGHO2_01_FULL_39_32]OGM37005.1 MAG: DNA-formamidopyrimidine glycosylase [Candidatus Woesebacteria bacterium RIFCSPHIGHO2_12_FULL_38_11]OGM63775.1 MAG: DNA-formamidopyrimidine glycosylase [Candidatus Woesebacteria bacterium RIFCSPLOWO2_01_FULL_39_25]
MPELPEVETVKLQLEKYLKGHKIENVQINAPKIFSGNPKDLVDAKVKGVRRFAKVLSIDLSNGFSIVIHIKLTGQLIYRGANLKQPPRLSNKVVGGIPGKHTHVVFELDKGGFLYYNDVRRFGWIKIVKSDKLQVTGFIGKLGPEPFRDLTLEHFKRVLSKTKRAIKVVLMDQTKIGGVGNIYANDALWLAKIDPKRPANELQSDEVTELYEAIHEVLKAGMKYGGASELAFVTPDGKEGEYQKHTLAYGHQGEPCSRCHKAKFTKYFLSGRGTYVCPFCQE